MTAETNDNSSGSSTVQVAVAAALPERRFQTLRRFARHKLAVVGAVYIVIVVLMAFPLASVVAPLSPIRGDLKAVGVPPDRDHFLGTDLNGRDLWSRVVYGGRVSMSVGLVAVAIYLSIGTVLGCAAGYYGGRVDMIIMRITDIVMSFPTLIILISIVAIVGPGLVNAMLAIGLINWTSIARLVRGQILAIREMDFITAAESIGLRKGRIIIKHVLPNVVAPLVVAASFGVAGAILTEAGLSFLGLGVQAPTPSWGTMINEARSIHIVENMLWLWIPPGVMITTCVLSINFVGDGLRDALDPRMLVR
jgi:peptide/nickel transport system permease protein